MIVCVTVLSKHFFYAGTMCCAHDEQWTASVCAFPLTAALPHHQPDNALCRLAAYARADSSSVKAPHA
jgi:hypothetical protein